MTAHAKQAPGPQGKWIAGHIPELRQKGILPFYFEHWKTYGDIFRVQIGPRKLVVLVHPEHANQVLIEKKDNYFKGTSYKSPRWIVGQGLVTSEGELWAKQRKLMRESFTMQSLKGHAPTMVKAIEGLANKWSEYQQRGQLIDVGVEMRSLTMRVISETMFGSEWDTDNIALRQPLEDFLNAVIDRMDHPFALPLFVPTPGNLRFRKVLKRFSDVIYNHMQHSAENDPNIDRLLQRLKKAHNSDGPDHISAEQVLDEVKTMFFAGYETTANSLGWTWMLLHQHPEVARKLRAELDDTLCGLSPTFDDLDKLKYTQAIMMESMRLYPPAWAIGRDTKQDDIVGGYAIKKGTIVLLPIYLTHRHPDFWSDPLVFRPERFLEGGGKRTLKEGYFPFSHGPRNCLGNLFSLVEMKFALAILAQRFELTLDPDQPITALASLVLTPDKAITMRLHQRRRNIKEYSENANAICN